MINWKQCEVKKKSTQSLDTRFIKKRFAEKLKQLILLDTVNAAPTTRLGFTVGEATITIQFHF